MTLSSKIKHFALTSRPYSYASEILLGIVFYDLVNQGKLEPLTIALVSTLSVMMWTFFNWQSDWIQKDKGRFVPNPLLCYSPLIISILIAINLNGYYGILGIAAYVATILLYSRKKDSPALGIVSSLLRGLTVIGHFTMIYLISTDHTLNFKVFLISLVFVLYKVLSNLLGDLRDIENDKNELPARYGFRITLIVLRLIYLAILVILFILQNGSIELIASFALFILFCIFFESLSYKVKSDEESSKLGYISHRLINFFLTVTLIVLFYFQTGMIWLSINFSLLYLIGQLTYNYNPGKKYKHLVAN